MKYKYLLSIGFRKVFIIMLIFHGTFFISCNKCDNKPTDFRNQYIGEYQVSKSIRCYGTCWTCSSEKDTVIVVNYGLTDSTLSLFGRDVCLDSDGYYFDYHYELRIWNDSIYSQFMNGGLGCGKYEIFEGSRISSKQ